MAAIHSGEAHPKAESTMNISASEPKRADASSPRARIIAPGPRASLPALIVGASLAVALFVGAPAYVLLPLGITFLCMLAWTNRGERWREPDDRLW